MLKSKQLEDMNKAFSSVVNAFMSQNDVEVIASTLCDDHRTLQQAKMRVVMEMIKIWADDCRNRNFDLRNEATCKTALKIVEGLDYEDFAFPCI